MSKHRTTAWVFGLALVVLVCAWAPYASAQPPRGAMPDPEPIWTLQAKAVAGELKLPEDTTQKLVDTYIASRKSHMAAAEKAREGGEGRERFEAYMKVTDSERAALKQKLSEFLNEEQTTKALATLGSFNRQWDRLVAVVADFKLEDAKQAKALGLIAEYVAELDAARAKASDATDWQAMRTAYQEAKTKLDTSMADVLSAEQLATWKQETAFRGGRGGGERGRRGGDDQ